MHRAIALAALLCTFATLAMAQRQVDPAKMESNYNEKLQKAFVEKVAWTKTLEEAKKKAEEQNKLIFGYFTRSYAP